MGERRAKGRRGRGSSIEGKQRRGIGGVGGQVERESKKKRMERGTDWRRDRGVGMKEEN